MELKVNLSYPTTVLNSNETYYSGTKEPLGQRTENRIIHT